MAFKDLPIQKKLLRGIILICAMVLVVVCTTFLTYEFIKFKQATAEKVSTIGKIISVNSTASLAFDNVKDAREVLASLKAEPHILAAALYNKDGSLFAYYPDTLDAKAFPLKPGTAGYTYAAMYLEGIHPVVQAEKPLGVLYIKSDLKDMYDRFMVYGIITILVVAASFFLSYLLSTILQKNITTPVLTLAETAKTVSVQKDYSVRAVKAGGDEIGLLTDAFNQMLSQIEEQNEALQEFNLNLEQKVNERTLELEAANKEMEAFSYSVSHDMRAPVRAINGFANLLNKTSDKLDAEGKELLDTIINEAQRMGQLIDDLLGFSRLGKKDIQKTRTDMTALAKEVVQETVKLDEANKKAAIVVKDLPFVNCDPALVRQVFINLVSNAIKFSSIKEKPEIEIGFREGEGETIYYVKDNGAGFDMKYYDKLFGIFQRLHSSEEFGGTGIGLAIVKRIIVKHGGKVWAEGKVNEGATFYFSLPSENT